MLSEVDELYDDNGDDDEHNQNEVGDRRPTDFISEIGSLKNSCAVKPAHVGNILSVTIWVG